MAKGSTEGTECGLRKEEDDEGDCNEDNEDDDDDDHDDREERRRNRVINQSSFRYCIRVEYENSAFSTEHCFHEEDSSSLISRVSTVNKASMRDSGKAGELQP